MPPRRSSRAPVVAGPEVADLSREAMIILPRRVAFLGVAAVPIVNAESLKIIRDPDPSLRKHCEPVEVFDASLAAMARRMLELMRTADGVGLAAPQVAVPVRLFVCNITGDPKDDMIFVNPRLADLEGAAIGEEGCLSLPETTVNVRRAVRCRMTAHNLEGETFEMNGVDLAARVWQHETDHLEGRLIADRMSEADKIANRRALKKLEQDYKSRAR
jgi:peptide deformylase